MSQLTEAQLKGKLKSIAQKQSVDARMLLRIYTMERFLERVSVSKYRENFIIKGGILIASLVGVNLRSTMDIDSSLEGLTLSQDEVLKIIKEIIDINLNDGFTFEIKSVSEIMNNMEYPGIRLTLVGKLGKIATQIKTDFSSGDAITPRAIEYKYELMLEDRSIELLAYSTETIFAEKIQSILSRGVLTTRMRDFYDIHTLSKLYLNKLNNSVLKEAFNATCFHRNTLFPHKYIINTTEQIANDKELKKLWLVYQRKYKYAQDIKFDDIITSFKQVIKAIE